MMLCGSGGCWCSRHWLTASVWLCSAPRHEMTERSRLLPFTCCCAMDQPCLCGWTPAWVSSGSTDGRNVINVFPSCRDCISTVVAGLRAAFHEAALCVENRSVASANRPLYIKVSVLCPWIAMGISGRDAYAAFGRRWTALCDQTNGMQEH